MFLSTLNDLLRELLFGFLSSLIELIAPGTLGV